MDMHSGGGTKESPYEYIYIEAPENEAKVIFYNKFGHNPERVTCTCCGEDYSIRDSATLAEASCWDRGAEVAEDGTDRPDRSRWAIGEYVPLDVYLARPDVLAIHASEIKPEERIGDVPEEGYVWR